eukprot:gene28740-37985_t
MPKSLDLEAINDVDLPSNLAPLNQVDSYDGEGVPVCEQVLPAFFSGGHPSAVPGLPSEGAGEVVPMQ